MDFLQANGAIINLQRSSASFSTEQAIKVAEAEERYTIPLRVVDEDVTVPPRSSVMVLIRNDAFNDYEGVADSNADVFL